MFERLAIPEVVLVTPKRHADDRGFFVETFRENDFEAAGIVGPFIQDNHSYSVNAGVVRGLHFQIAPYAQAKLVRCTRGKVFDVVVDLRSGSPTFGQHVSATLSADTGTQLYVPVGFAHGFCTLEPHCEIQYKVSAYYNGESERGLAWDDPALGIDWPLGSNAPILSEKDAMQPRLDQLPVFFHYAADAQDGG